MEFIQWVLIFVHEISIRDLWDPLSLGPCSRSAHVSVDLNGSGTKQWSSLRWIVFDRFWAAFSICIFRSQIPLLTWTQRMSSCILEFPKVLCLKTSHAQKQAALSSAASWPTCNASCYGQSNLLDCCERWIHVLEAIGDVQGAAHADMPGGYASNCFNTFQW